MCTDSLRRGLPSDPNARSSPGCCTGGEPAQSVRMPRSRGKLSRRSVNSASYSIYVDAIVKYIGILVSFVDSPMARANGTTIVSTIGLASITFVISATIT